MIRDVHVDRHGDIHNERVDPNSNSNTLSHHVFNLYISTLLSEGMFTLEKVPTRLVSWVAQSVQIFRVSAESKGLKIDYIHPASGSAEERKLLADIDPLKVVPFIVPFHFPLIVPLV